MAKSNVAAKSAECTAIESAERFPAGTLVKPIFQDDSIEGDVVEYRLSSIGAPAVQTPAPNDKQGVHGVAMHWSVIDDILSRLDQASRVARRIDARQRKLDGDHATGCRSPVLRLAGLIKGIYNTLDRAHGRSQYVDDVSYPIPRPPTDRQ
jgi:hypothetical protein